MQATKSLPRKPAQARIGQQPAAAKAAGQRTSARKAIAKQVVGKLTRDGLIWKVELPTYTEKVGVDKFVRDVINAPTEQKIEMERNGLPGLFVRDLSGRMGITSSRLHEILAIPRSTSNRKQDSTARLTGGHAWSLTGLIKLLGIAAEIVEDSTAEDAKNFDIYKWLGQWLQQPQPSLGGKAPAEYMDTPTGVETVARLLGSLRSGAYQ